MVPIPLGQFSGRRRGSCLSFEYGAIFVLRRIKQPPIFRHACEESRRRACPWQVATQRLSLHARAACPLRPWHNLMLAKLHVRRKFCLAGWALCEGAITTHPPKTKRFTELIGTTYGGDGESTFALPDLRGRIPIHQGNGFILAETGGAEEVTPTVIRSRAIAMRCGLSGRNGLHRITRKRPLDTATTKLF